MKYNFMFQNVDATRFWNSKMLIYVWLEGYKYADGNIGVNEDGIITLPLYMITFV